MEFCDLQQVVGPVAKIEQLDFSIEFPDAHEGADQMCQARAVDVIDIGEIERNLFDVPRREDHKPVRGMRLFLGLGQSGP